MLEPCELVGRSRRSHAIPGPRRFHTAHRREMGFAHDASGTVGYMDKAVIVETGPQHRSLAPRCTTCNREVLARVL